MDWLMILNEPDVALTDFWLTLQALLFLFLMRKRRESSALSRSAMGFWLTLAMAALLGGLFHGFQPLLPALTQDFLWKAVMLTIGWNNIYLLQIAWGLYALQREGPACPANVKGYLWLLYVPYAAVILMLTDSFAVAIGFNTPAIVAVSAVYIRMAKQPLFRHAGSNGLLGMGFCTIGAVFQVLKLDWLAAGLTYNALYHLWTSFGLFFLYHSLQLAFETCKPSSGEQTRG